MFSVACIFICSGTYAISVKCMYSSASGDIVDCSELF